jgi:acyl-coenzyme A synthetase/AMP-(fatty) acid ligase
MIPEAAIAMLACARVGAVHTVIFGGFSAEAIKDRIKDCYATLVITADGGWRRGKIIELKANVDRAVEGAATALAPPRSRVPSYRIPPWPRPPRPEGRTNSRANRSSCS